MKVCYSGKDHFKPPRYSTHFFNKFDYRFKVKVKVKVEHFPHQFAEEVESIPDGAVDENNLLDFSKYTIGETYRDVHISEELNPEQRNQIINRSKTRQIDYTIPNSLCHAPRCWRRTTEHVGL